MISRGTALFGLPVVAVALAATTLALAIFSTGVSAQAPANDDFANATVISAVPYANTQNTTEATFPETNEPDPPCVTPGLFGKSVWYRFDPALSQTLIADTAGSDFETVVAVWRGTQLDALQEVDCNDIYFNGTSFVQQARVAFSVSAGQTYYLQIGGKFSQVGQLSLSLAPGGPANDLFANATQIDALPFATTQSTDDATAEIGEPIPFPCPLKDRTVWFKFTNPVAQTLLADTAGSNYDTVMTAWRGTDIGSLVQERCGDNHTGTLQARVQFVAAAGQTYYFQVDGSPAAINRSLNFSLTGTPLPNEAPVANNQSTSTNEDTVKIITLSGSDADGCDGGQTFTFNVSQPASGGVSPASGSATCGGSGNLSRSVSYTPNADFNGSDPFTFKFNDGTADSNTATVSVTVNATPDPPAADDQSTSTDEDTAKVITLGGSDADGCAGQTFTFNVSQPASGGVAPASGSATCSGGGSLSTAVTYTPSAEFNGSDPFTFKFNDGTADSNTATVSITVNPTLDPPVADDLPLVTDQDTAAPVTLTGSDIDGCGGGQTFTFNVSQPPNGGVAPASGGATCSGSGDLSANVTYTPNSGISGPDSFTYELSDGTLTSNTATVSITVNPVATVLVGDADCDGDVDAVDALFILQNVAGLRGSSSDCPPPSGSIFEAGADADCDADVDAVDALFVLQHVAGLRPVLCP